MVSFFRRIEADNAVFGIICVLIATLGLSFKAILIKLIYQADPNIDAISILALRFVIAMPFFLLLLKLALPKNKASESNGSSIYYIVVLGAVGFYLSALLDFSSLAYISAGLERLILFLYPTFVVIISYFIRRQEITKNVVLALFVSYLGVAIVFIEHAPHFDANVMKGVLLVFTAAVVFAFYTVGSVHQIKQYGSIRFTAFAMMAATVVTLCHAFFSHGATFFVQSMEIYVLIFVMAIVSTVVPLILMAEGVKRIGAPTSSILSTAGPVITLLLAYFILDEVFGVLQSLGAVLIIVGIFFVTQRRRQAKGGLA